MCGRAARLADATSTLVSPHRRFPPRRPSKKEAREAARASAGERVGCSGGRVSGETGKLGPSRGCGYGNAEGVERVVHEDPTAADAGRGKRYRRGLVNLLDDIDLLGTEGTAILYGVVKYDNKVKPQIDADKR